MCVFFSVCILWCMKHHSLVSVSFFFFFFCARSLMCVIHISVNEHKQTLRSLLNSLLVSREVRKRKKTRARLHQANCFSVASSLINDCGSYRIGLSRIAGDDVRMIKPKSIIVLSALLNSCLLD